MIVLLTGAAAKSRQLKMSDKFCRTRTVVLGFKNCIRILFGNVSLDSKPFGH